MAEAEDYLTRQQKKMLARQMGSGNQRTGTQNYSPAWELHSASLPAYNNDRTLLQNPATGAFLTMTGIDGTPADPLGRS